ncbi:hypothetical protein Tco_0736512 [Tanacetum coccineum]
MAGSQDDIPPPPPPPSSPSQTPTQQTPHTAEPSVHKDPLFDELPDDTLDYMDTKDSQDVGRTRDVVNEEKETVDDKVSTEDALSTAQQTQQKVSTDKEKAKDSTVSPDEGTDDQTEGRSAPPTTPTISWLSPLVGCKDLFSLGLTSGIRAYEIPPPPPPPSSQTPTQQTPHTVSTIKLPILKKGEYDIWAMKMEHYLAHTDYPIWEVIQNGNGPVSITTDTQGQIKVLPPRTAEEILARERERKARTTLLTALPEDHLAKSHKMTDAKEMWDAIKSRFGRNDESKKISPQLDHEDLEQLDEFNLEEMDLKWQVAMISMRMKKFYKKTCRIKGNQDNRRRDAWNSGNKDGRRSGKQEDSKALVTIDGEGVDWTNHSEEEEDYALMACNSSDTEVTSCSKECIYSKVLKKAEAQLLLIQQGQLSLVKGRLDPIWDTEWCKVESTKPFVLTAGIIFNRQAVPTNAAMKVNTVKPIVNTVRPKTDYPHKALQNKGIVDSGCSRHMTGNKAYLAEYQDFNGGPVAFGGSKGYITGKGKIKIGKLDFEDVCFVKEL